ncbi:hypothetical protein AB833_13840 [Chromatiales bacterium (ex Bugula neritina AB1)]|nr:hypothetical protein AB833_13840 [Chromatiales bacterium (ex Bugula neritina AB1)]
MVSSIVKIALLIIVSLGMVIIMPLITPDSPEILDHNIDRFNRFALGFLCVRVIVVGLLFTIGWRFTNHYFIQHHAIDLTRVRKRWAIFYLLIEAVILMQILKGGW